MRTIQGAIFDLDGTLLDSMAIWDTVGDRFLLRRSITPPPNLRELLKPLTLEQSVSYLKERYGFSTSIPELMQEANDLVEDDYRYHIPLKPTALPFLEQLERQHVKLCIATATDRYLVEAALRRLKIDRFFPRLFTCTEVGISKRKPDIFEQALTFLGTERNCTVVFEDSLHAIKTAVTAGFPVAALYDKSNELRTAQMKRSATWYLRSFSDFPPALLLTES